MEKSPKYLGKRLFALMHQLRPKNFFPSPWIVRRVIIAPYHSVRTEAFRIGLKPKLPAIDES